MGGLLIASGDPRRARGSGTCSIMAWRLLVLFSLVVLLDESLADQRRLFNNDHSYDRCEGDTSLIANGVCDISVNTADCGFDGGDCCECTCAVDDGSSCDPAEAFFLCRDPDVPLGCDRVDRQMRGSTNTSSYPRCTGYIPHIRDGRCNEANNNAYCGFDGGDCCPSTCVGGACGDHVEGFDCRDPQVVTPRRRLNSESCGGDKDDIGNKKCDSSLNNFECGYDGGDCCQCTCTQDLTDWTASDDVTNYCLDSEFDCLDPSADCEIPTPNPTPSPLYSALVCQERELLVGNGFCDILLNTPACNWDGGDCCECTCDGSKSYACVAFDCLDPNVSTECVSDSSVPSSTESSVSSFTGSPVPSVSPAPSPPEGPVPSPTEGPVPTLSASPVSGPTESPVARSTGTPVPVPTESPVQTPTASDVPGRTATPAPSLAGSQEPSLADSPVRNATVSPVLSPLGTSAESDTEGPAQSDSVADSDSSTSSRSVEGEGASTSSATRMAPTATSIVNWQVVWLLSASVLGYWFT